MNWLKLAEVILPFVAMFAIILVIANLAVDPDWRRFLYLNKLRRTKGLSCAERQEYRRLAKAQLIGPVR